MFACEESIPQEEIILKVNAEVTQIESYSSIGKGKIITGCGLNGSSTDYLDEEDKKIKSSDDLFFENGRLEVNTYFKNEQEILLHIKYFEKYSEFPVFEVFKYSYDDSFVNVSKSKYDELPNDVRKVVKKLMI
jgi:hypothetical protein